MDLYLYLRLKIGRLYWMNYMMDMDILLLKSSIKELKSFIIDQIYIMILNKIFYHILDIFVLGG
jgi:hypothetical protein